MVNWIKTRSTVEHTEAYFPELRAAGDHFAQMFHSSPQEGSEDIRLMYLLTIAGAAKRILLEQAYFVPDDLTIELLVAARKRGVEIEIITPGPETDKPIVRRASRARWGRMLEAGVRIYEFQPTMYHCKVLIVDEVWVSVGSTNFDDRSFRLNDEVNLNVYDAAFAMDQVNQFEEDKRHSRLMTRAEFADRSLPGRVIERIAGMLRRQL